jgi:hypothetical protein
MNENLLTLFLPYTYSLILASDPDGLLVDEELLSTLTERGFTIIQETDPILLRFRVEQARPFRASDPVIIITAGALEALPYDLWQQGQPVTLALHTFFPNLSYPILRTLTPLQRARLGQVKPPREPLGERRTVEFLLANVFGLQSNLLPQPAWFILWLDEYHQTLAPLPAPLLEHVLAQLHAIPAYQVWPLKEILQDRQAYRNFVQDQWHGFLFLQTGKSIGERPVEYVLHFETDQALQDALPRLLRNGSLTPVQVETQVPLPVWVVPGVLVLDENPRPRRILELIESLNNMLAGLSSDTRWEAWQMIARQWAELSILYNASRGTSVWSTARESDPRLEMQSRLDVAFADWLTRRYSPLATQKLPTPHHAHHIPHYLNYLRSQGAVQKLALLVMDGMSLSDWLLLKQAWQARRKNWQFKENLVLAQIPTITAISRHALISGLRPADFYVPNATKSTEPKAWSAFWLREGLPENAISFLPLNFEKNDPTPEITNPRLQALCLIERKLDEIMHGSMLGDAGHQNSIELWLSGNQSRSSAKLEIVIQTLLDQNFTVFITSDHGHCEAVGMGAPAEGLMAQSRGRRARLYTDRRAAEQIRSTYDETILWERDGLLPQNLITLMPTNRQVFTEYGEIVVTHGGITIDEIVVPLIEITRK